jgi:hypothetical protein
MTRRERETAYTREWRKRNPEKHRAAYRRANWKKYGVDLTEAAYAAMVAGQGGRCAICRRKPDEALCVDHDHATRRVRGLLCKTCNSALGLLGDGPDLLRAALEYLG